MKRKKFMARLFHGSIVLAICAALFSPRPALAAPANCPLTINGSSYNQPLINPTSLNFDFDISAVINDFATKEFKILIPGYWPHASFKATLQGTHASATITKSTLLSPGTYQVQLLHESDALACNPVSYTVAVPQCSVNIAPSSPDFNDSITIEVKNMAWLTTKTLEVTGPINKSIQSGSTVKDFNWQIGQLAAVGQYNFKAYDAAHVGATAGQVICERAFGVRQVGAPTSTPGPGGTGTGDVECDRCLLCKGKPPPRDYDDCMKCTENGNGAWTALGCIPTDPASFVAWVLAAAIKIGGGIAFLLMLGGGFTIMASSGNPEQLNKGKSMITSAVSGLLFIIFSVLLLRIIGIDILQLPGFNP